VAVGAAHGLVEKEHQRLLDLPKGMGARVAEVVSVNDAHNMLEFVHPCLSCEWRFVPAITKIEKVSRNMYCNR
jgi:hypothetical protein